MRKLQRELPGSTWVVKCSEVVRSEQKLLDLTICGAFVGVEKANEEAQQVAKDRMSGLQGGKVIEQPSEDGCISRLVVSFTRSYVVEVRWESGIEFFDASLADGNRDTHTGPICSTCHKPQSELGDELKHCARCRSARYCSKECQKKDWKTHKRSCTSPGATPAPSQSEPQRHDPGFKAANHLHGLTNDGYLHKLPEKEAFAQIIDCFRMRVEDEYAFAGNNLASMVAKIPDQASGAF